MADSNRRGGNRLAILAESASAKRRSSEAAGHAGLGDASPDQQPRSVIDSETGRQLNPTALYLTLLFEWTGWDHERKDGLLLSKDSGRPNTPTSTKRIDGTRRRCFASIIPD